MNNILQKIAFLLLLALLDSSKSFSVTPEKVHDACANYDNYENCANSFKYWQSIPESQKTRDPMFYKLIYLAPGKAGVERMFCNDYVDLKRKFGDKYGSKFSSVYIRLQADYDKKQNAPFDDSQLIAKARGQFLAMQEACPYIGQ